MNTFFGCDVVGSGKRQILKLSSTGKVLIDPPLDKRKDRSRATLNRDKSAIDRKIFSEYKIPQSLNDISQSERTRQRYAELSVSDRDSDKTEKLSLSEILIKQRL